MPSTEVFDAQDEAYREAVLPQAVAAVWRWRRAPRYAGGVTSALGAA